MNSARNGSAKAAQELFGLPSLKFSGGITENI